jgi:hypothetical protein
MEKSVENVQPDFKAIYTPIETPNSVSDQGITNAGAFWEIEKLSTLKKNFATRHFVIKIKKGDMTHHVFFATPQKFKKMCLFLV